MAQFKCRQTSKQAPNNPLMWFLDKENSTLKYHESAVVSMVIRIGLEPTAFWLSPSKQSKNILISLGIPTFLYK